MYVFLILVFQNSSYSADFPIRILFAEIEEQLHCVIKQNSIRIQEKQISPFSFPDSEVIRPAEPQISVAVNILYALILRKNLFAAIRRCIVHQYDLVFDSRGLRNNAFNAVRSQSQRIVVNYDNGYVHLQKLVLNKHIGIRSPE